MNTLFFALIEPSKSNSEYYIYYAAALTIMFAALILVAFYILLKIAKQTTEEDEREVEELFTKNNFTKEFFEDVEPELIPAITTAINCSIEDIEKDIVLGKTKTVPDKDLLETLKRKFYVIKNHFENSHLPTARAFREFLYIRLKLNEIEKMAMT